MVKPLKLQVDKKKILIGMFKAAEHTDLVEGR